MEKKYRYLGFFMMLLIPLVFLGFYFSYFKGFPSFPEQIDIYDHLHAALASAWIALLIIQPMLISRRKYDWHRKLGRFSYFLFPLMILSFLPNEIQMVQGGRTKELFYPGGDQVVLISLYVLAMLNKKHTPAHMRYMIGAALVFLGPTFGRIGYFWLSLSQVETQTVQYGIVFSVLGGLTLYDGAPFKKSKPYFVAMVLFLLHAIVFYFLFA